MDLAFAPKFPNRTGCLRSTGAGEKSFLGSLVAVSSSRATNRNRLWTFSRAVIEELVQSAARAGGMTKASRWSHKNERRGRPDPSYPPFSTTSRAVSPWLLAAALQWLSSEGTCDSAHVPCAFFLCSYTGPNALANLAVQNVFSDLPPCFRTNRTP